MGEKIKQGSRVKFHYIGKLETGEAFDSSKNSEPLAFEVGKQAIIPGLEKGMLGMEEGEKKTIKVKAEDAYGKRKKELIREIPKGPLPEGMKLEKGSVVYLRTQDGYPFPAKIVDVKKDTVVLDLNHPLAGKNLVFDVEIVSVEN